MKDELKPWAADPASSGLWLDYDGTLAPIVDEPDNAFPLPEVPDLLRRLNDDFGVVSVVSGRSAEQLVGWLGSEIEIWGLLGAQRATPSGIELGPHVIPFSSAASAIRDEAEAAVGDKKMDGLLIEDKGVVVTFHYRQAEDREAAARFLAPLADRLAAKHGFVVAPGRATIELRPPVQLSKAEVVGRQARELNIRNAFFMGDDLVDLEAFAALDELASEGRTVLRVAVDSDEAPADLIRAADLVVAGPGGAVGLLRDLVPD